MIDARRTFKLEQPAKLLAKHRYELFWRVPTGLSYFEGHFPGKPVMPAVGVLDGSLEFLAQSIGSQGLCVKRIDSAKFSAPIEPQYLLRIILSRIAEGHWQIDWFNAEAGQQKPLAQVSLWL